MLVIISLFKLEIVKDIFETEKLNLKKGQRPRKKLYCKRFCCEKQDSRHD